MVFFSDAQYNGSLIFRSPLIQTIQKSRWFCKVFNFFDKMVVICLDFKWLGFKISNPFQNPDVSRFLIPIVMGCWDPITLKLNLNSVGIWIQWGLQWGLEYRAHLKSNPRWPPKSLDWNSPEPFKNEPNKQVVRINCFIFENKKWKVLCKVPIYLFCLQMVWTIQKLNTVWRPDYWPFKICTRSVYEPLLFLDFEL